MESNSNYNTSGSSGVVVPIEPPMVGVNGNSKVRPAPSWEKAHGMKSAPVLKKDDFRNRRPRKTGFQCPPNPS